MEGIETLLSAAEGEQDVDVLKHLLATASFAKKFTTPTEFDPNRYVNLVKHSIVLTNMRYSDNFARAITFAELKVFKPKNVVRLLLKFRDYRLAIKVIELLNLKSLHLVYEDFCHQMLKQSKKNEIELIEQFEEKFDELAAKLAIDQGFSYSDVEQAKREKSEIAARAKQSRGNQQIINQLS